MLKITDFIREISIQIFGEGNRIDDFLCQWQSTHYFGGKIIY
jgi:hypothetical protein